MTPRQFTFHRRDLAAKLVDSVMGQSPFEQASGLFLAAPRGTGKSTFLRLDMVPELRDRGAVPILVDLWSDRSRDPTGLIVEGIKDAIRQAEAGAIKAPRQMGVTKFGVGGVNFDLEKVGVAGGITIADALRYLFDKTGRPVALIIDEAQHALNGEAGLNAMFAIKAARDALNQNEDGEISLGRRPEQLFRVLKAIAFSEERAASIKTLLANDAAALRSEYMERFETAFGSLEPLQKAVLIRLIEQGDTFAPFSGDSLAAYGRTMGEDPPNIPAVQKAIAGLREQGIVWQPARGDYVLEDGDMATWFRSRTPGQLGVPAVDPDSEG